MPSLKFELRITLIYLLVGGAWILFSDQFLLTITNDQQTLSELQTYKGWFYVATTSVLLFFLVKKHVRRLRKAEEEAVRSNKLKTAFLQNISHEIRTPMNSILGFSELLNSDEINREEAKEYIHTIHQSTQQLLLVVDELMEISMIETGNMKLNPTTVNINDLLQDIRLSFSPLLKPNISLKIKGTIPEEKSLVTIDEGKLRQILYNLLSNANKYTDEGEIELEYTLRDEQLYFRVSDTGIGIAEDVKSFVFERFRKVHNEKRRQYDGVGLGLAICKGNVDLMGGSIDFTSELDKGSTFFFSLPYSPAEA